MEVRKEIIEGCLNKDSKAQYELYRVLYSPLLKVCKRYYINEEDALTAFHNGLLKIWSNLDKYRYEKSFLNWARVIMINGIIDDIRKNKKRVAIEKNYDLEKITLVDNQVSVNLIREFMDWEYVEGLLKVLPEASRLVFNMYVFEGYNHREIGAILGISEGTSKWHLSNARRIIKSHLPVELASKYRLA